MRARWNVADGRLLSSTVIKSTLLRDTALSPDGNTFAVCSGLFFGEKLGNLALWDLRTGTTIGEIKADDADFATLAFSPDGRSLAMWLGESRGLDNSSASLRPSRLTILDTTTLQEKVPPFESKEILRFLVFSADGSTLAASVDRTVRLWDAKTLRVQTPMLDPTVAERDIDKEFSESIITSLAIAPDGKTLALRRPSEVLLRDAKTGRLLKMIKVSYWHSPAFGDGGRSLAIPTESGYEAPLILDLESGREFDWSIKPFPSRTTAYWAAGLFLFVAVIALASMKRRFRARGRASIGPFPEGAKRRLVLVAVVGFAVLALSRRRSVDLADLVARRWPRRSTCAPSSIRRKNRS